ncbi:MAG: type II toxin-antitoxin system RelE/ParE family toxin [Tannerella sp.]|jgi:proteic killer suppression protein|nr:type II toxin-antitoxin system RelE/ParE family toxin [Tannerella sp.]
MIVQFEKEYLRELYYTGKTSGKKQRFQPQVANGLLKCVRALEDAKRMTDLYQYNALNYERLSGDKEGLSSLRVNKQYRLEFREIASEKDLTVIEICSLVDITNHYQ